MHGPSPCYHNGLSVRRHCVIMGGGRGGGVSRGCSPASTRARRPSSCGRAQRSVVPSAPRRGEKEWGVSQPEIVSRARPVVPKTARRTLTREIIETIVLTLLIFFAVHYSIQPYQVDGPSMQPGLVSDCDAPSSTHCERVLVNLLAYDFGAPARGDVIVFHPPTSTDPNLYYVKRIIARPGDTIQVTPSSVYVNGVALNEPYIAGYGTPPLAGDETVGGCSAGSAMTTLGKDEYWVMGDNRTDSVDSRCFGPIARQSIVGKADGIVWPFDSIQWLRDYSGVFAGVGKP